MSAPRPGAALAPEVALAVMGALDDLPLGVSILAFPPPGQAARRVYANRALAELSGYTLDEIYAAPARLPIADDEAARVSDMFRAWLSDELADLGVIETAVTAKDGRRVPIEARVGWGQLGGERLVVTLVSDISGRLRAAEAQRASEGLFRQLAEAAPDAIVISVEGRIVYANHEASRVTGYAPAELPGLSLAAILEPDEVGPMIERIRRLQEGERLAAREYRAHRKDGTRVTVEISATPIRFQGQPAILAVGRDVEPRVRRQAEMIRADRMAAVGTLAAGVAHEINNPLTYVILQLDRLRARLARAGMDTLEREACDAMLVDAIDGSQRVAQIVRDLLSFARDDGGLRAPVDVRDPIATAIKLATGSLRQRARLDSRIADVPAVAGNAARLTQVFLNLVVNAAQAFERDAPDDNHVDISVREGDDGVIVDVADNGPGIPEELARRVFEPFFTTKASGTGLGLAISRSIVEEGGGRIAALARPGGGTIMRVWLPRWGGGEASARASAPRPALPRARILIVDDDAVLARAVAGALGDRHDATIASSGAEALERLAAGEFAVIVCDVAMPGLTGVEVARRAIAARPGDRGRFLFVTGGAVTAELAAEIAALDGVLVAKPFDVAALEAAIAARLAATATAP